jgi:uncharacterized membrane protein
MGVMLGAAVGAVVGTTMLCNSIGAMLGDKVGAVVGNTLGVILVETVRLRATVGSKVRS